ncbi:MAG: Na/Pi cotransporter family protein [Nitrospirae bacterium]|nr:Na/Pi cotransporter family protein [Candidatus Manganitrophaceae bacterium]
MTPEIESILRMILLLAGGVAVLLHGLQLAGNGLQDMAGKGLKALIASVTKNRILGTGFGAFLSAAVQSSSATTVLLVGLSRAGLVTLPQAIPIILGADIGTTLTVQLISFQIQTFSPLIIAIGFLIQSIAKKKKAKAAGMAILGFGFIFLAFGMLTQGMRPFQTEPWVQDLLRSVEEAPFKAIAAAALLTALLHSSAATLGIALAMSGEGLLTLKGALPIILGANIGTSAPAWIASFGGSAEAKRVAMAHLFFKVVGALLLYPFLSPFETWIAGTAGAVPRQIANAHTFFNFGLALLFLPLAVPAAKWITWLVSAPPPHEDPARPKYLDTNLLDTPSIALEQAAREALRMADIVRQMFRKVPHFFTERNESLLEEIERREEIVDRLNQEIKLYLTRLSQNALTPEESAREMAILELTKDLENIGDIIDKNLIEMARKKLYTGLRFSDAGLREVIDFHKIISDDFDLAIAAFAARDPVLAERVIQEKGRIRQRERELSASHIQRLHEGISETIESTSIHLDVLTNLRRITSHITSIAHTVLDISARMDARGSSSS